MDRESTVRVRNGVLYSPRQRFVNSKTCRQQEAQTQKLKEKVQIGRTTKFQHIKSNVDKVQDLEIAKFKSQYDSATRHLTV